MPECEFRLDRSAPVDGFLPGLNVLSPIFRWESGRVLAGLIGELGDFDAAKDVWQDALSKAAEIWSRDGVPENPGAWLTAVARNRAREVLRRAARGIERHEEAPELPAPEPEVPQVALTLRTLGGLTTFEIARAFLESALATAQRLVRAKKKIREAKIPYAVPTSARLLERLEGVLSTLYLVFNEGYSASQGDSSGALTFGAPAERARGVRPARVDAAAPCAARCAHHRGREVDSARGSGSFALAARKRSKRAPRPSTARSP